MSNVIARQTGRKVTLETLSLAIPISAAVFFSGQFIAHWATRSNVYLTSLTALALVVCFIWHRSRYPADINPPRAVEKSRWRRSPCWVPQRSRSASSGTWPSTKKHTQGENQSALIDGHCLEAAVHTDFGHERQRGERACVPGTFAASAEVKRVMAQTAARDAAT